MSIAVITTDKNNNTILIDNIKTITQAQAIAARIGGAYKMAAAEYDPLIAGAMVPTDNMDLWGSHDWHIVGGAAVPFRYVPTGRDRLLARRYEREDVATFSAWADRYWDFDDLIEVHPSGDLVDVFTLARRDHSVYLQGVDGSLICNDEIGRQLVSADAPIADFWLYKGGRLLPVVESDHSVEWLNAQL